MAEPALASETFEAPVQPESLDVVQDRLAEFWTHDESVSPADRMRLELAVVEVAANIVEHAFAVDADRRGRVLTVALTLTAAHVEAVLCDNGLPVAIDLGAVTMPDEDATSGRGLALAVAAVDEVVYERVDGRNSWRLVCRRTTD
jgi:serine/threonine-protein kinase RsbW